uniref:Uncharacterized protein Zinc finger Ran-binding family protein n=1 Tax=Rhizophora mucronata TaxID=61149 RepID=A0A2P2JRB9_RHIMU
MLLDRFAIGASSLAYLWTPRPRLTPNGYPASVIGFAMVGITISQQSQFSFNVLPRALVWMSVPKF